MFDIAQKTHPNRRPIVAADPLQPPAPTPLDPGPSVPQPLPVAPPTVPPPPPSTTTGS
ncbi:MAG: hypothetical protein U0791_09410 [Gemmataceae bacterium]